MANARVYNRSFAGGEISPEMFGRIDDAKYQVGAAKVRNFFVTPRGPVVARPGFVYCAETKDFPGVAPKDTALIPFQFNRSQAYVIELGDLYFRIHKNGAPHVVTSAVAWLPQTAVTFTNGSPWKVNWAGHTLQVGDVVQFNGGTLPAYLNTENTGLVHNTDYYVVSVEASAFQISATKSGPIAKWNSAGSGTINGRRVYRHGECVTEGGNFHLAKQDFVESNVSLQPNQWETLTNGLIELTSPFSASEVRSVRYAQKNDVLTLVHPNHKPVEIFRLGEFAWGIRQSSFGNQIAPPTTTSSAKFEGGVLYKVVKLEGLPGGDKITLGPDNGNHGIPVASTLKLTGVSDGTNTLPDGLYDVGWTPGPDEVVVRDRLGNTIANFFSLPFGSSQASGTARVVDPTVDESNTYVITSVSKDGVESNVSSEILIDNNLFAEGGTNLIEWEPVAGAVRYNVYKKQSGLFGYVGKSEAFGRGPYAALVSAYTAGSRVLISRNSFAAAVRKYLVPGTPITLSTDISGTSLPSGVSAGKYYIKYENSTFFAISATLGGTAIVALAPGGPLSVTANIELSFVDDNIGPDMSRPAPVFPEEELFSKPGDYPSSVAYFEQRRIFGGTANDPQRIWAAQTGSESNFGYHFPIQDTDRIEFEISSNERSRIQHLVSSNDIVALTEQGEMRISSGGEAFTPNSVSIRPQSFVGANEVQPQIVNSTIVYCSARGGHVRELGYNWQLQTYVTGDLSVRSAHLFDGKEIVSMSQGKAPYPVLWFVSSDGSLLGFTYSPEEQVGAWHRHETDGQFISICSIPEGLEDRLYAVVRRGNKQYVERLNEIIGPEGEDYIGLDCARTSSGFVHANEILGVTESSGVYTLTAASNIFAPSDVGDYIVIYSGGSEYRVKIESVDPSGFYVSGHSNISIPPALTSVPSADWAFARDTFGGLSDFEGQSVSIVLDGVYVGSKTVSSGAVSANRHGIKAVIGLPYVCDLETVPVSMQIDGFAQGRAKAVNRAWIKVYRSAGIKIGPDAQSLTPVSPYTPGEATVTDEIPVFVTPAWMNSGAVLVRQDKPYPVTVLGMTLEIAIGG